MLKRLWDQKPLESRATLYMQRVSKALCLEADWFGLGLVAQALRTPPPTQRSSFKDRELGLGGVTLYLDGTSRMRIPFETYMSNCELRFRGAGAASLIPAPMTTT